MHRSTRAEGPEPPTLLPPAGRAPPPLPRDISMSTAVPKFKISKRFRRKTVLFFFFSQEPEMLSSDKHRIVSEEQQSYLGVNVHFFL